MSPEAIVLAAMGLILLHRADGTPLLVAPQHITTLIAEPVQRGQLITGQAHCVVTLVDRKLFAVRESCTEVQRLIDEAAR